MHNAIARFFTLGLLATTVACGGNRSQYLVGDKANRHIDSAIKVANQRGCNVLIQIGGEWCNWCVMLDSLLTNDLQFAQILRDEYVRLRIFYGPSQLNAKVMERLGNPEEFAVPVFVVISPSGNILHTQETSRFEVNDVAYNRPLIAEFLNAWRRVGGVAGSTHSAYNPLADANAQIDSALALARERGSNVLLQVGGDWCPWCRRLDSLFTVDTLFARTLREEYVWTHIYYGPKQKNPEAMERLGNPEKNGFPVLLVLSPEGNLLHTQETGSLEVPGEKAYSHQAIVKFLNEWRDAGPSSTTTDNTGL